jgi:hypothetical protein
VGGLGKYSYGSTGLSHQHWVQQVISAGSFNVHCTEAAEAVHKTCMRLASKRVKHMRQNLTQRSMLRYLRQHTTFEAMLKSQSSTPVQTRRVSCPKLQIKLPLQRPAPGGRYVVTMGDNLHQKENQERFLHPEVRLARVELMDLLCERLRLPKTLTSYQKMNQLEWIFGQKLITSSKATFWATDSRYISPTSENMCRRRDTLLLRGTENIAVQTPLGEVVMTSTALCCETVCFLTIGNLNNLKHTLPWTVAREVTDSTLDYLLRNTCVLT